MAKCGEGCGVSHKVFFGNCNGNLSWQINKPSNSNWSSSGLRNGKLSFNWKKSRTCVNMAVVFRISCKRPLCSDVWFLLNYSLRSTDDGNCSSIIRFVNFNFTRSSCDGGCKLSSGLPVDQVMVSDLDSCMDMISWWSNYHYLSTEVFDETSIFWTNYQSSCLMQKCPVLKRISIPSKFGGALHQGKQLMSDYDQMMLETSRSGGVILVFRVPSNMHWLRHVLWGDWYAILYWGDIQAKGACAPLELLICTTYLKESYLLAGYVVSCSRHFQWLCSTSSRPGVINFWKCASAG